MLYSTGVEETLCTHCSHRDVCSLKDQYLAAQSAVNEVMVHYGDNAMKRLRDFDWIERVKLKCTHFVAKETMRKETSFEVGGTGGPRFMEDPN